jgi:enoyl-CoA hydratase/carnithine racemase
VTVSPDEQDSLVLVEDHRSVRVITLNRPHRLNAITPALVAQLGAALTAAQSDAAVRAIVLTGSGTSFCAGDDLHDAASHTAGPEANRVFVERLQDVTRLIMTGPRPVIAAVRGWAVGGGLEWLLNADLVVAGSSTKGFFPELSLGLFPTGAVTAILPRVVGDFKTRELLLLGERIDASMLQAWGIAYQVVPDEAVLDAGIGLAQRLADLPERSVTALKRALARVDEQTIATALEEETIATIAAFDDPQTPQRLAERAP